MERKLTNLPTQETCKLREDNGESAGPLLPDMLPCRLLKNVHACIHCIRRHVDFAVTKMGISSLASDERLSASPSRTRFKAKLPLM